MEHLLLDPNHPQSEGLLSERLLEDDGVHQELNNPFLPIPEGAPASYDPHHTSSFSSHHQPDKFTTNVPNAAYGGDGDRSSGGGASSRQPDRLRDFFFLILFVLDLGVVFYLGLIRGMFGSSSSQDADQGGYHPPDQSAPLPLNLGGIFSIFLGGVTLSLLSSALMMALLNRYAHQLIPLALGLALSLSTLSLVIFAVQRWWAGVGLGILLCGFVVLWARRIWNRIPFAASVLQTAMVALQANGGVVLVAYGMVLATCLYTVVWIFAWVGVYTYDTMCHTDECDPSSLHMNAGVALFLILSYYWTCSVLTNCLHVTVGGVVGTWWFAPDLATSFWSSAIRDSWIRSTTTSLGSVCLGSLLVAILQVTHQLLRAIQNSHPLRRASFIVCVAECGVKCLERVVAYFNKYAFVYIGLYGYDFLESGHRTYELFQQRGWTMVVNDDLVSRVLQLTSIVVGLGTAAAGVVMVQWHPAWTSSSTDSDAQQAILWSFLLCLVIGTVVSDTVVRGVVASACDTILVCFAEAPRELEQSHPGLHRSMIQAWQQVYPDETVV